MTGILERLTPMEKDGITVTVKITKFIDGSGV